MPTSFQGLPLLGISFHNLPAAAAAAAKVQTAQLLRASWQGHLAMEWETQCNAPLPRRQLSLISLTSRFS